MKDWYLIYCKRNEQERVVINLDRQGVECYYPQVTVEKLVRGKRIQVLEALFPNYMFVYFDPEVLSYTTIRSTRGVVNFIRQGARPQTVSPDLIYGLMMNEDSEEQQAKLSQLPKPGEMLKLTQGKFKGIEAIYQEPDGEKRSFMLINLLGKPVKVSVQNEDIVKHD
ncbi:transcription/translation regulatory transformer protein RfaH [Photobacterium aphoticum]|uniref:Transcription antitermination protein RfaH n=1 Tax=Photobacterium aphoticum TaxID=754436 RepID=A0A0J1GFU4_9GAMM|nr:transcription/translation regulatory transformer protein RfaH [Photobacterium aphoticum]KLU98569.1 transcriptional regulator [Photobacterium aphoticum]PSU55683.1 transcription/translation regulatory transformer protein RfaH [Photobacterium aphoticum]GHA38641.1 transcription antitermination protein RfaH [Photobacterium aphoticum]